MKNVLIQMRNKEIVRMIDKHFMTKTAVAKWFRISKQRVDQIYKEEKADVSNIRTAGDGKDNRTT
tara:strand:- start:5543 stop:5737 length:195 start_codon:yes stop_codon:yes gene_type:complete